MRDLVRTGDIVGERVVVQPFWDDYKQELESEVADIKNLGGPEAGHITAGKFLEYFIDYPWIHLDIAGVSWTKKAGLNGYSAYHSPGATAFGVRLIDYFLKEK